MTRIVCAEDCGNSPRRLLLKKLLTALAKGDNAFILRNLSDDIIWERAGDAPLRGKGDVARMLDQFKREAKAEMVIDNIVTHGPSGAANGRLTLTNGQTYAFSHFYRFSGARDTRIKQVTAYSIRT